MHKHQKVLIFSASTELCPVLAPSILYSIIHPCSVDSFCVFQGVSAALRYMLRAGALVVGLGRSVLISCLDPLL